MCTIGEALMSLVGVSDQECLKSRFIEGVHCCTEWHGFVALTQHVRDLHDFSNGSTDEEALVAAKRLCPEDKTEMRAFLELLRKRTPPGSLVYEWAAGLQYACV